MKKKYIANILLLTCGIFASILLLEIMLRVFDPFEFRVRGNEIIVPANKEYTHKNDSCDKLEKYSHHTKNSLGFRGPEKPPDFENMLSLVAVGGSTTECLLLSDKHDWPYLVGENLKPSFKNTWINNAGFDGHSTYGHYILMQNYLASLKPKIALFLVGTNDTEPYTAYFHDQSLLKNNSATSLKKFARITAKHLLSGEFRTGMKSFYFLLMGASEKSRVASCLLNFYRYTQAKKQKLTHDCVDFASLPTKELTDQEVTDKVFFYRSELAPKYRKRLLRLIECTRNAQIYPIFITQPALYGGGIDPDTEVDMNTIQYSEHNGLTQWKILETFNDITREIAEAENIPLIDLAHKLPKRSLYFAEFV